MTRKKREEKKLVGRGDSLFNRNLNLMGTILETKNGTALVLSKAGKQTWNIDDCDIIFD